MKYFLKTVLEKLEIALYLPLLVLWRLTQQKQVVLADVDRWVECLGWPQRPPIFSLALLLSRAPEFRNLYYYRVALGGLMTQLFMVILKSIYPEQPTLFIDRSCTIGPGLFIQHGFSTIIMADLGENCWVNQQVTIGHKDKTGRPKIGNHVRITAGAKVIGNITIGDEVTIGANAVVVKDVPAHCVVVGVPAYIVRRNGIKVQENL